MQQPKNEEQAPTLPDQTQGQKQVDGPDRIIVNEQQQNIPVNPQDEDIDDGPINQDTDNGSIKEKNDKKKGYEEGNRNDSGTDDEEMIPDEEPERDII